MKSTGSTFARQQELSRQTIEMERARWGGIQMVVHMTRRDESRFVEEALFVRGYDPNKNLWLTDPLWPVRNDNNKGLPRTCTRNQNLDSLR